MSAPTAVVASGSASTSGSLVGNNPGVEDGLSFVSDSGGVGRGRPCTTHLFIISASILASSSFLICNLP